MKISEYIAVMIKKLGIDVVFGYQGGNITYLVDAVSRTEGLKYVQTYHEQGAAFAANAYAQVKENFGVAISSSGPGAMNMINGIANAYYDSIPCLFITGNVNTRTLRKNKRYRQNAFQEADIVSVVKPITKYAKQILDANEFKEAFAKAIHEMRQGRPGPALLDMPHDIQRTDIEPGDKGLCVNVGKSTVGIDSRTIQKCMGMLRESAAPVIVVGGGSRKQSTRELLCKFVKAAKMPIVSSLCGKDAFSNDHECYMGMIGTYGNPYANDILKRSDLAIVLGSRLDERQIADSDGSELFSNKKVIHIDIDEEELDRTELDKMCVHCDVDTFLRRIIDCMGEYRSKRLIKVMSEKNNGTEIGEAIRTISNAFSRLGAITGDVGMNQMLLAQNLCVAKDVKFLNSGGLGSMGYGLPAAIGAAYASPQKQVLAFVGDGGLLMNVQELQTISRDMLPITVVIMNNSKLQMIADYQKLAFEQRYFGSVWGYSVPDFWRVAEAFGVSYYKWPCEICDDMQPKVIEITY